LYTFTCTHTHTNKYTCIDKHACTHKRTHACKIHTHTHKITHTHLELLHWELHTLFIFPWLSQARLCPDSTQTFVFLFEKEENVWISFQAISLSSSPPLLLSSLRSLFLSPLCPSTD